MRPAVQQSDGAPKPPVRLLLIEDDPDDARLIQEMIHSAGGELRATLEVVERLDAGMELVREPGRDAALLDLGLPDSTGLATLESFLETDPAVPVIILTAIDDGELGARAVQAGAQDYLVKDRLDGTLLARGVRYSIERHHSMIERRRLVDQLRRTERMEAVGELAGGVAHDFNNLLTGILGHTDFILEALPEGSPVRDDAELVRRLSERAAKLTQRLLAFSRRNPVERRDVDLGGLIGDFLPVLEKLVGERVRLTARIPSELRRVEADPVEIEHLLINLAVNARDAMPDGGELDLEARDVTVTEDEVEGLPAGTYVSLSVADTGTGMDPDVRKRAFEPFFTTKKVGRGTGLGLASVSSIVERHDGHIVLESEPGRGTTFRVYLQPADARSTRRAPEAGAEVEPEPELGPERGTILVVDDEPAVVTLAERMLSSRGYRVLTATSLEEAEGILDPVGPGVDVLLTDVVMFGAHGPELYRRLLEKYPDLEVVYMSAYAEHMHGHSEIIDSRHPFVAKPFDSETLLRALRTVLKRQRGRASEPC